MRYPWLQLCADSVRRSAILTSLPLLVLNLVGLPWVQGQDGIVQSDKIVLRARLAADGNAVEIVRVAEDAVILTQHAKPDFRPYVHPWISPDGNGQLTQFSPGHHPHQTGLYWGFTRLNGRDYFHNPDGSHWRRVSVTILKAEATTSEDVVQWQTVYDLLDSQGQAVFQEAQIWTLRDQGQRFVLDLQWNGQALMDVTVGKYDYGGLFLRMPWSPETGGQVLNSTRHRDSRAEGERSVWLDVSVGLPERDDRVHVAIFDHPSNSGYPQHWRVDSQLGVGPVRVREGDWKIARGQQEVMRHRLIAYSGEMTDTQITALWSDYSGQSDSVMWGLAQQQGRQAQFLSPQQALEAMTIQPGIRGNVFAAEPMISQPMAFCWDARGRLWVAENRDYESRSSGFSGDGTSRILILEDADRDGIAESSKVFLEGIPFPSAIAVGMDGLWLGAPPNLLFVPDCDRDDRGDMDDIQVRLTGWGIADRHETLNSLHWGPDGWLYGLQGFATPSRVGKPKGNGKIYRHGEPFPKELQFEGEPVDINGGVWRYHPNKQRFEVVAHGFSNPWGIDYDQYGQLFITACVIPHLWHVIPGGIYHRQGGSHFNPYVYDDIKTIAMHRHRSAHGGARVYQSDALEPKYHGRVFMANIHEHAVLTDIITPQGSGYVARHGDDFALANNAQWVGFSVEVGRDGAIYALDWHDADICGKEVLHKETGRVFRFAPERSLAADFPHRWDDLETLTDLQLAELQQAPSVWHATFARVILQHRSHSGTLDSSCITSLQNMLATQASTALRLRALWTLHVTGLLAQEQLLRLLSDSDGYIRAWSIQLACEDGAASDQVLERMVQMAQDDPSPVVRLYLAAACQRVSDSHRWLLLEALTQRSEDQADHNIPKMLWFALEPLVTQDPQRSIRLAGRSNLTLITRHVARRMCDADLIEDLIASLGGIDSDRQVPLLLGIRDAYEGRFDVAVPKGWTTLASQFEIAGGQVGMIAKQLSQQFGDSVAAGQMLLTLKDENAEIGERRQALIQLAGRKRNELKPELERLLESDLLRRDVIRAMSAYDDARFSKALLGIYHRLSTEEKQEAIYTLSSRSRYANDLTNAMRDNRVPKRDVPAHVARLMRRVVGNRFVDVWGPIEELSNDKQAQFAKYRELLTESRLASADLGQGRELFQKTCASCHLLQGQGGKIGPDITGANRGNLEYLLSNILTPSAVIQDDYRMHIILMDDGRIFSGIPDQENDRTLKLQVADQSEPVLLSKSLIESREIASVSMMPDGLLSNLNDAEVVNLIAYLRSVPASPSGP